MVANAGNVNEWLLYQVTHNGHRYITERECH